MQIDTDHIRTLTDMGDFLQYLVSLYGKELYKDKQHLCNLIADLYRGEERQKKLFRRAILEDNMARRVYELAQKSLSERKALADAIAYQFAENNYLTNEIGEKVTSDFIKGINLFVKVSWKQREDGNWEDNQGCVYNNDKTILLSGAYLKEIVVADGTIEIGDRAFFMRYSLEEIKIPNSVIKIGHDAFGNCTSLEAIIIPNSVTEIKESTFEGCTSLKAITIPNSVTEIKKSTFEGCTSLKAITIPNSVHKIGCYAFYGCTSLEAITIPDGVHTIEFSAFRDCTLLEAITIPDSVHTIEYDTFYGCTSLKAITIPNSVTNINNDAFWRCTSLEAITIPNSVTNIGHAFYGTNLNRIKVSPDNNCYTSENNILYTKDKKILIYCTNRTSLEIPESVTEIEDYAFKDCTDLNKIKVSPDNNCYTSENDVLYTKDKKILIYCTNRTSLEIPENVTEIRIRAFINCALLETITIPKNVKNIVDVGNAFANCTALNRIKVSPDNDYYTSEDNVLYTKDKNELIRCTNRTYFEIPNSVKRIRRAAFYKCTLLSSITIPNSVTKIEEFAFYGCTSLKAITIPNSVTNIGLKCTFYGCTSLADITLSEGMKGIGLYVFKHCTSLTTIKIPESMIYHIGIRAFSHCTSLTSIKIPNCVKSIGDKAFEDCTSLTTIQLPNSLEKIEWRTFQGCTSLKTIIASREKIEKIKKVRFLFPPNVQWQELNP